MADLETDVLIIGTGPTGATAALALATYGVRTHMISRWNWLADTPRAHITNQRTMEVLRDLGIEDECRRAGSAWELMGDTMFTTSLAGEELLRLRTWGTGERKGEYERGSPCPLLDLIQPEIEPILLKNAAHRGASFGLNTEYVRHVDDGDGVTTTLRDLLQDRTYTVRSKYLIGADGARSQVAENIGLNIEGHMARAGTAYAMFDADLTKYVEHRPSVLHWIVSPDAAFGEIGFGLLRAVRPWTQWIAGWGIDISKGEPDLSEAATLAKIRALVGDPTLNPKILRASVWYVNQAYATSYSKGRVFCGGDAVHRHPPSSGLGLNTCVQDAFNLAWKLAYVIKGYAGPDLLETYSVERAPVGKQVVLRANQSRLDYGPLKEVFKVEGAANPVAAGIERFKQAGPEGEKARRDAQAALELKNKEFNAQGVEMNQRYESSAVVSEPGAEPEVWEHDRELHLRSTSRPGAKIPHAWLIDTNGRRISSLDLVGKGQFTLVTGIAGTAWAQAAQALNLPYLRVVATGAAGVQDAYCDWQARREIEEAGALLVRPDGYVAWRKVEAVYDANQARRLLSDALSAVLGTDLHNSEAAGGQLRRALSDNAEPMEFDPHYTETFDNTHELYTEFRNKCPVAHSKAFGGFWALFKYEDVVRVQEDSSTFITSVLNVVPPATRNQGRRAPLHYDPPEHTLYRRNINLVFQNSRMRDLQPAVEDLADELLTPLLKRGTFDFTQDFAEYFAAQCFGLIINLPKEMLRPAREAQVRYYRAQVAMDRAEVVKWSDALYEMARTIVAERKKALLSPETDLVSALLTARDRGDDISDEAVVGSIRQFLSAAQAAPQAVLGSIAVHLCRDQALQQQLRRDSSLINDAVEELLRLYAPYRVFARSASTDVEIGGRVIKAGEAITMMFPSANRDEDVFERPHEFDLNRKPNKHIAFGRGAHQCPAASLARLELRIATRMLLERTEKIELAGEVKMSDWLEFGPSSTPISVVTP